MDFLIIGGDAAGMSAASRAKRNMPDMNVVVLEMTRDVSYSACGMPYNIADPEREIDDLVVRQADVFREKQGINLLTGHYAEKISPQDKIVTGRTIQDKPFSFSYDKLLIATGSSPAVPDIPGISQPGVMSLKSLDDGRKLKSYLTENNVNKAVIIGMGYIALEMCEALAARGIQVDMVKPRAGLLPWMEQGMSDVIREELKSKGIGIYDGHKIEQIQKTDSGLSVICSDMELKGDMVITAVGVKPGSKIAEDAGLKLSIGNSIAVNKQMFTSDPHILAAGDCADAFHIITDQKTWIPLALRANRAGWAAADNVCGQAIELPGIAGTAVFKVFDLQAARTGFNAKEAEKSGFEPVEVTIKSRSRAHRHPGNCPVWVQITGDKKSGRLLGMQIVGKEGAAHRINAPAVALHAKMSVEQFVQTDMAYAPPFGPTWDPMLTAANQLLKKL
ncbi:FAD-dependent pyridine nucleotide-disulfide oxidoreductase [Desulfonema limicola]|uniref:FAD-dependent pyridine nucleotide-disulfide oxidoreductase n=1 Tax=Desulfonema limicola TaxID=45656 RepID=A0A975GFH3_9BACT|nr:FAD-dependent oxidoreductase [Desulfonema limicola]QTA79301.1 FAD-dependent pyridine nucleotide-disulfide oxidoreductase [Desulfonema limicola]